MATDEVIRVLVLLQDATADFASSVRAELTIANVDNHHEWASYEVSSLTPEDGITQTTVFSAPRPIPPLDFVRRALEALHEDAARKNPPREAFEDPGADITTESGEPDVPPAPEG